MTGGASRPVVLVLSGPNLNLLGERQPAVYGYATLADHLAEAEAEGEAVGLTVEHYQSNHEGDLVDAVHRGRERVAAVVVNAGALSHYSWALHDALVAFSGPVVEVHLSNPAAREGWRRTSVVSPAVTGSISGLGGLGYRLAIRAVAELLGATAPSPPAP